MPAGLRLPAPQGLARRAACARAFAARCAAAMASSQCHRPRRDRRDSAQATEACKGAGSGRSGGVRRFWPTGGSGPDMGRKLGSPCGRSLRKRPLLRAEECVITEYSNYDEVSFCTPEEVKEVTAALGRAYKAGETNELAVLKRFHQAYRGGRKADPPRSVHSCAG